MKDVDRICTVSERKLHCARCKKRCVDLFYILNGHKICAPCIDLWKERLAEVMRKETKAFVEDSDEDTQT